MFTPKGSFVKLSIDVQRYTKTLDENMKIQVRQAAREWLRAVIQKVPVWAGSSRGSLQPLGRFLRVAIPINPRVTLPGRGPSVGAQQSDFSFDSPRRGVYEFAFDEQVAHYRINEFFDVTQFGFKLLNPTPWHSFVAGEAAFQRYVEDVMPGRLPRIEDSIVQTRIQF